MPEARATREGREQKRLGRGLSALMGDIQSLEKAATRLEQASVAEAATRREKTVPVEHLRPSAQNPRLSFDDEALEELAASVRTHGVLQPLIVRRAPGENGYVIVAGERRWRAAQKAGLHEVPVVVREVDEAVALELAIIENVQRADLNPIEEGRGYRRLMDEFGHRQEDLAKLIGKSRSHVANTLRLLNLPASICASVADGSLSAGHARALLSAPNPEALADEVMRRGLSVRATEALVARAQAPAEAPPERAATTPQDATDADTRALARRLSNRLGLSVALKHNADESGAMTIRYTSLEQLDALCRSLGEPV